MEGLTTGESIAAEIRLGIVSGEILSDTLLTENQIAKQFNVSRSPVRDAFKLLQTDQLIHLERMGSSSFIFWRSKEKEKCMIYVSCLNLSHFQD